MTSLLPFFREKHWREGVFTCDSKLSQQLHVKVLEDGRCGSVLAADGCSRHRAQGPCATSLTASSRTEQNNGLADIMQAKPLRAKVMMHQ